MAIKIAGVDVINDDRELVLAKLTDINETINSTAVDVFIYDTSKDSDGGAWRHRTQHTSWYNETLDTDIRGIRKEFPSVAVIVAEEHTITIYDGDDPSLPMWMIFPQNRGALGGVTSADRDLTSVAMLNGVLVGGYGNGLSYVNFLSEVLERGASVNTSNVGVLPFNVSERDQQPGGLGGTLNLQIRNANVNDVAMTVLPDAPTDPATGLPVPTIAVATNGGVSVIKDDGTVVDLTYSISSNEAGKVWFTSDGGIAWTSRIELGGYVYVYRENEVPALDKAAKPDARYGNFTYTPSSSDLTFIGDTSFDALDGAIASNGGLTVLAESPTTPTEGMVAYTTSDYTTGWLPGSIKLAALANSATADRSVNNNPLTQNGTITAAPVATGADLVGYSGFSTSNYLEQPYNSALNFGAGDFSVMGWVSLNSTASQFIVDRADASDANRFSLSHIAGNGFSFRTKGATTVASVNEGASSTAGWKFVCGVRSGTSHSIYVNGVLAGTTTATAQDVSNTTAPLNIGGAYDQTLPTLASLALWRISATAPTADQIAKIYEDEKVLFQPNAKATLTGSSSAVTALAHDPDTNLLHVGTSGGRSVFQGLRRVEEHTGTNSQSLAAISAVDGLVVEGK